jgi:hypothetical protein
MDAPAKAPHVEEGYRRLAVEPRKLWMLAQGVWGEQREGEGLRNCAATKREIQQTLAGIFLLPTIGMLGSFFPAACEPVDSTHANDCGHFSSPPRLQLLVPGARAWKRRAIFTRPFGTQARVLPGPANPFLFRRRVGRWPDTHRKSPLNFAGPVVMSHVPALPPTHIFRDAILLYLAVPGRWRAGRSRSGPDALPVWPAGVRLVLWAEPPRLCLLLCV